MRLFIAVPLPAHPQSDATRILRGLRARDWPVRWVRDDGLHVTLKFFGEVTSDRVDAIAEMLTLASKDMQPLAMTLTAASVLPSARRPRVITLDLETESDLELLQDRLERLGEQLGFPPEGRPFRPHVTLGRVREGHRLPSGWDSELERISPGDGFLADRVALFESRLTPEGPMYTVRHEVVLA